MLQLLRTTLGKFRIIAFTEGVSYLILLFIAMPLKYVWGQPMAVRTFGSIHGLFFILYVIYAFLCKTEYRWPNLKLLILLGISFIPFGNFYADKRYLQDEHP
jgi:integral membrane protein